MQQQHLGSCIQGIPHTLKGVAIPPQFLIHLPCVNNVRNGVNDFCVDLDFLPIHVLFTIHGRLTCACNFDSAYI